MEHLSAATLCIYPRKGLFQVTTCNNCSFSFTCEQCDARLVVYKKGNYLSHLCHHCQTWYGYPKECPQCHYQEISSFAGGIDKFAEEARESEFEVIQLEQLSKKELKLALSHIESGKLYTTTRIFDPSIPYTSFDRIIIIRAESLLASPDYLVSEETHKQLMDLILHMSSEAELIFDTDKLEGTVYEELLKQKRGLGGWYTSFLQNESNHRQTFGFPPFENLVLYTTQEKTKEKSWDKIQEVYKQLKQHKQERLTDIEILYPYPARMLKRKGMFSHHCLLKFPKQYSHFAQISKICQEIDSVFRVQVRLNPRHIF